MLNPSSQFGLFPLSFIYFKITVTIFIEVDFETNLTMKLTFFSHIISQSLCRLPPFFTSTLSVKLRKFPLGLFLVILNAVNKSKYYPMKICCSLNSINQIKNLFYNFQQQIPFINILLTLSLYS